MNDLVRILRHFPLLSGCSPAELNGLDAACRRRALGKDDALYREGEPARSCFLVVQGEVERQGRRVDGRNARIAVHGPGTLIEAQAISGHGQRADTCVARARALVLEIDRPALDGLLRANNRFAFAVLDQSAEALSGQLRAATDDLSRARTGEAVAGDPNVRAAVHAVLTGARDAGSAFGGVDLDQIRFEAQRPRDKRDG